MRFATPLLSHLVISSGSPPSLLRKSSHFLLFSFWKMKKKSFLEVISNRVLLLAKGTATQKQFLVPLFAIQAPAIIISWMKYAKLFLPFVILLITFLYFTFSFYSLWLMVLKFAGVNMVFGQHSWHCLFVSSSTFPVNVFMFLNILTGLDFAE